MATIASKSTVYFLFLVYFVCETVSTQHIPLVSSHSPTVPPTSWPSPSGRFAFGFYQKDNGLFKLGIWLFDRIKKTIVWTANRDDPPVSSNARLVLTINGELLLQTGPGHKEVIALAHSNNGTVSSASMLDSGNFVL
ncbi:hypothetical protein QN277_026270 [Acacia crassicarpa]|uniref:Bulb-type lectin domain-containing protein n=1 Tax=Acacia crassicarpa TaxID=499986 RepID=A0AAE1J7L3_9FABA|nr:hypothetical protein QN277_026270 [Acacia crassicarpa]